MDATKNIPLVRLDDEATTVLDADEEQTFLLYTRLSTRKPADGTEDFRGLGYIDSRMDVLTVKFDLKAPTWRDDVSGRKYATKNRSSMKKKRLVDDKSVEIELHQDKTALHSRKGDTGSVLWKASIDFAQRVLQDHHAHTEDYLLNSSTLARAHVIELGAGTGLLSIVLSPLCRRYTVTDVSDLLPLIRKNLTLNSVNWPQSSQGGTNVPAEELDWIKLASTSSSARTKLFPIATEDPPDLLLIVDCIYHPSLLGPLVDTIDYLSVRGKTSVLVVSELRAADMVGEFLDLWLKKDGWKIYSLGSEFLGVSYAVWVGCKPTVPDTK